MNDVCLWTTNDKEYIRYHNEEWGHFIDDDKRLFEFLILETNQAGLSWLTILKKRHNYKKALYNYDIEKIANFDDKDIEKLLNDDGIIKNKLKILSMVNNAKCFLKIQKEFGSFSNYIKTFLPDGEIIINNWTKKEEVPTKTLLSDKISKDMKKRGFKFFGSITCYSFLQAVGFINDHLVSCKYKDKF